MACVVAVTVLIESAAAAVGAVDGAGAVDAGAGVELDGAAGVGELLPEQPIAKAAISV